MHAKILPRFYPTKTNRVITAAMILIAARAFQWTCDRQAEIEAVSPLDHVLVAEEQGWQLEDEVAVHEQGFNRRDGQVFETRDVFEAWLRWPVPVV